MRKLLLVGLLFSTPAWGSPAADFTRQYINGLSSIQIAREKAYDEANAPGANGLLSCIRGGTAQTLQMSSVSRSLRSIKLSGEMSDAPELVAGLIDSRSEVMSKMVRGCQAMLTGPRPGVDLNKLAAEAPAWSAELDFIDKGLFEGAPLIMMVMVDSKPDANGKMSRLSITCQEKRDLIELAEVSFKDIGKRNPPYLHGAVQVVWKWLRESGHTCINS